MKQLILYFCLVALLNACAIPNFVGDTKPIPLTSQTPKFFELPARFALARVVYGEMQPAGTEETELWANLADRAEDLGSFSPLVAGARNRVYDNSAKLVAIAREQRYNYLILIRMYPSTGSADVVLYHVGSNGVMATVQTVSPAGGRRGFLGGQIRKPARLERATLAIAKAAVPAVEEMLQGVVLRQR